MYDYDNEICAPWIKAPIKKLTIEEGITDIGTYAFYNKNTIYKFTEVVFPNSLTNLKTASFFKCNMLQKIFCNNSKINVSYGAFEECTNLLQGTPTDKQYVINTATQKQWLISQECNSKNINISNEVEIICQKSLLLKEQNSVKFILSSTLSFVSILLLNIVVLFKYSFCVSSSIVYL